MVSDKPRAGVLATSVCKSMPAIVARDAGSAIASIGRDVRARFARVDPMTTDELDARRRLEHVCVYVLLFDLHALHSDASCIGAVDDSLAEGVEVCSPDQHSFPPAPTTISDVSLHFGFNYLTPQHRQPSSFCA